MAEVSVSVDGSPVVKVQAENVQEGTLVRIVSPARAIPFKEVTPIFEDLGINIISFGVERGTPAERSKKTNFRGQFLVRLPSGLAATCAQPCAVYSRQHVLHSMHLMNKPVHG